MTRLALIAVLLVTLTSACGAPAPGGDGGTGAEGGVADSWVRAGESACRGTPMMLTAPCTTVEAPRASRIGVLVGTEVYPLERALGPESGMVAVMGLDTAAIARCDFTRFPNSSTCGVVNTCGGYDSIRAGSFVAAVAREFVRTGRCW